MLTGDKVETAVNIALSCRLFDSSMSIVELRERDLEEASSPEQQALVRVWVFHLGSSCMGHPLTPILMIPLLPLLLLLPPGLHLSPPLPPPLQILQRKIEEVSMENLALHAPAGETCVGLVVDGGALAVMLHPEHQDGFVQLCSACRSVVCCRVSPMQKVGGGGEGGSACWADVRARGHLRHGAASNKKWVGACSQGGEARKAPRGGGVLPRRGGPQGP